MTAPVGTRDTAADRRRRAPRHWPLAWKLAVVGAVPLALAGVFGGLHVADRAGAVAEAGDAVRTLEQRAAVASAADALRRERHDVVLFVSGPRPGDREVVEQRFVTTDGALTGLADLLGGTTAVDESSSAVLRGVATGLASLPELRSGAVGGAPPGPDEQAGPYTTLIRSLDVLDAALLRQVTGPGVPALAAALEATAVVDEQLALQHTVVGTALRTGSATPAQLVSFEASDRRLAEAAGDYAAARPSAPGGLLDATTAVERRALVAEVRGTAPDTRPGVSEAEWDAAHNGAVAAVALVAERVSADLAVRAATAVEQARTAAWVAAALVAAVLLLASAVAVRVTGLLLRAVGTLRETTHRVATRDLPEAATRLRTGEPDEGRVEPVPLDLDDELGDLARTFDDVHEQAVRLAVQRRALGAVTLALARHHHALVEQQLQLIERVEDVEQDRERSGVLRTVGHLAARIRRHSENLLIVHGAGPDRAAVRPVPIGDVLRVAVAQVEHHRRVQGRPVPPGRVVAHAARDVIHLVAELVDNATRFSPPGTDVVVMAVARADGGITIQVADQGLGLSAEERAEADHRLRSTGTADLPPARRLGLHVVGRLSRHHGIVVQLLDGAPFGTRGLVAVVELPPSLVEPVARPRPARSAAGARGVRATGSVTAEPR